MQTHPFIRRWTRQSIALAAILLLAVLILSAPAAAAPGPDLNPLAPQPVDPTYEQLADQWYAWALSYPSRLAPWADPYITDDPFGYAPKYGQSGPVWFLAGNFFPGTYERYVTVPAGKALFFPLVNTVWLGFPDDPELSIAGVNKILADQHAFLASQPVTCEIDGVSVASSKAQAFQTDADAPFAIELPSNNWLGLPTELSPCWQIGIYVLLAAPSSGQHTIHFTAKNFPLDITYHLTVKKGGT